MTFSKIRVRYAPSPTGEPHLGNIRTALFDWLIARNASGEFIVRIRNFKNIKMRSKLFLFGQSAN